MDNLTMSRTDWMLLGLLSLLWGSSFIFVEIALQSLTIFTIVFLRISIAALVLTLYLYAMGYRLPNSPVQWGRFLLLGLLRAALPISLIVWAQTHIDSGVAGILNSTSPLFTAIIAHMLTTDDKLTRQRFLGIVIGMIGIVVLIGADALGGLGSQVVAQIAMLGATCSYGFAAVYGRQFKDTPPTTSAAGMLIGAAILILPLALLEQPWLLRPSMASVTAVLGLSLFSTALAFIVWFRLIFRVGASNTAMVTFLIPITTLLLGYVVLDERVEVTALLGLAVIFIGLAVMQNRFFKRPMKAVSPS